MACRSAASSTGWTTARLPPRSRRGAPSDHPPSRVPMSGDTLAVLAVALAAGWASGVNAYATVLVLGLAQRLGLVTLPHDLQVLASWWVLAAAALLFALNFLADKIPLVDSINDVLHTFVRIPAGALLAFGATDGLGPEASTIAALIGGLILALAHPITFLCLLALFVVGLVWLLPKLVRLAILPFRRMARWRQQP